METQASPCSTRQASLTTPAINGGPLRGRRPAVQQAARRGRQAAQGRGADRGQGPRRAGARRGTPAGQQGGRRGDVRRRPADRRRPGRPAGRGSPTCGRSATFYRNHLRAYLEALLRNVEEWERAEKSSLAGGPRGPASCASTRRLAGRLPGSPARWRLVVAGVAQSHPGRLGGGALPGLSGSGRRSGRCPRWRRSPRCRVRPRRVRGAWRRGGR